MINKYFLYTLCAIIFILIFNPNIILSSTAVKPVDQSPNKTAVVIVEKNNKGPNYFPYPHDKGYFVEGWNEYFASFSEREMIFIKQEDFHRLMYLFREEHKTFLLQNQMNSKEYFEWEAKLVKVFDGFEKLGDNCFNKRDYLLAWYLYRSATLYASELRGTFNYIYEKYCFRIEAIGFNGMFRKATDAYNEYYHYPYDKVYYKNNPSSNIFSLFHNKYFITKPSINGKDFLGKGYSKTGKSITSAKADFVMYNKKHYSFGTSFGIGMGDMSTQTDMSFGINEFDLYFEKDEDYNTFNWSVCGLQLNMYNLTIDMNYFEGKTYYFDNIKAIKTYDMLYICPRINLNLWDLNIFYKPEYYSTNWGRKYSTRRFNTLTGANLAITNHIALGFYYSNEKIPPNNKNIDIVENYEGSIHISPIPFGWGRNDHYIKLKLGYGYNIKYYNNNTSKLEKQFSVGLSYYYQE